MKKTISTLGLLAICAAGFHMTATVADAKPQDDDRLVQNWGPWSQVSPAAGARREFSPKFGIANRTYNIRPGQVDKTMPEIIGGEPAGDVGGTSESPGPQYEASYAEGELVGYVGVISAWPARRASQYVFDIQGNEQDGYTATVKFTVFSQPGIAGNDDASQEFFSASLLALHEDSIFTDEFLYLYADEGGGLVALDADDNDPVLAGALYVSDQFRTYFRFYDGDDSYYYDLSQEGIVGYVTPISVINDFAADNLGSMSYVGQSIIDGGRVELAIDFAAAAWTGQFDVSGVNESFNAGGVITGQDFQSVSGGFSANVEADLSMVRGSFYGAEAQGAAGVYDVVFDGSEERVIDSFATVLDGVQ